MSTDVSPAPTNGAGGRVLADELVAAMASSIAARQAFGAKDALETRWWSLVIDRHGKVFTIRNGSCGDALLKADVPRIIRALEDLDLMCEAAETPPLRRTSQEARPSPPRACRRACRPRSSPR